MNAKMLKRHFSKRANSIRCVHVNRLHEFVGGLTFIIIIIIGDAHTECVGMRCTVCRWTENLSHTFYGVNMHKINENSLRSTEHNTRIWYIYSSIFDVEHILANSLHPLLILCDWQRVLDLFICLFVCLFSAKGQIYQIFEIVTSLPNIS